MRKSKIEGKILNHLLIGGAIILALQHPANMRRFLKRLPKDLRKYKELRLMRALYRLKNRNKIEHVKDENNNMVIRITENGRKCIRRINFDNITLEKPLIWDKKWRLVIFDIPEKKKPAREALREKLKDIGLKRLQDSVYVTPFPCEKEINLIKIIFNLSDYWIDVIITENLGTREFNMRKYFDLI